MEKSPVKLYYNQINNMGDALNPLIFERIFGTGTRHARRIETCEITGIGSFLRLLFSNESNQGIRESIIGKFRKLSPPPSIYTWGTGFMTEADIAQTSIQKGHVNYLAVRGELSRKIIQDVTKTSISPVLGDGGILVSNLS